MNDTINSEPSENFVSTNRVSLISLMERLCLLSLGVEFSMALPDHSHSVQAHQASEGEEDHSSALYLSLVLSSTVILVRSVSAIYVTLHTKQGTHT